MNTHIDLDAITEQTWPDEFLHGQDVMVRVLRLDKIHPLVSGNKWFKLRYYLDDAIRLGKKKIITWGGPWSNHLLATAAACRQNGIACIGLVRGEEPITYAETLMQAMELGMELKFIPRSDYRDETIPPELTSLENYFIPAGGYGEKGVAGAASILDHCNKENYTHISCAIGTGTMMAGLLSAALPGQQLIGISVLKNEPEPEERIKALVPHVMELGRFIYDFHFGGYARYTPGLLNFMNRFYKAAAIPTDFVYTGKLFFAINELLQYSYFPPGTNLLVIHSGGLQGNRSLNKGTLIF